MIACFEISANDSTAQNEQIQIDINAIRTTLGRSGYRTKLVVVLMSDKSILHAPELEDRLSEIRRATTLDPKHGLFFMPPMSSQAEIATFVQTILTTLQPLIIEHYRDLTKHARRKKVRGGPPPSVTLPATGGSQSLSTPGWNVRYETKQGVFAEFRQEMDVAERHYSAAVEELFSAEGIFETTPSWSPRWNEARLLCDALALRVIRCELWNCLTSSAALSWVNYRARMKDLIDRRGMGSLTYSWAAWEARWAETMAQLIRRAKLPVLQPSNNKPAADTSDTALPQIYALPERIPSTSDRLPPFHFLHHPGYWQRLAVENARVRRERALAIPDEDRTPPGQSPASAVAHRAKSYDTYQVPEPHEESPLPDRSGYDHLAEIRRLTYAAVDEFAARGQVRSCERLQLNYASELAGSGRHKEAIEVLVPLWNKSTWRENNWDELFEQILVLTHDCATQAANGEVFLVTAWELLRQCADTTPLAHHTLADYLSMRGFDSEERTVVTLHDGQRLSPVSLSFAFSETDGHVGDSIECQVSLSSCAARDSSPIVPSRIELLLTSGKLISVEHKSGEDQSEEMVKLTDLSETQEGSTVGSLAFHTDLSLKPAQTLAFNFIVAFREARTVRLERATVFVEAKNFVLEHRFTDPDRLRSRSVIVDRGEVVRRRFLTQLDSIAIDILPKPPKLKVLLHGLHKQYYTNEAVSLKVELVNGEAEGVDVTSKVHNPETGKTDMAVRWDGEEASVYEVEVGRLDTSASRELGLLLTAPSEPHVHSIAVEVRYTLASDPDTPLMKTLTLALEVVSPLDAQYSFGPLLHADPWPSYFDLAALSSDTSMGILHKWHLDAQINLLATENLLIRKVALVEHEVIGEARCTIHSETIEEDRWLQADQPLKWDAELVTQKLSLDDRRPTALDLSLEVTWLRDAGSSEITTSLPVPRLTLPSSEPRVLCTASGASSATGGGFVLQYHLENPSLHFLTFALTMEANDDFAFSGPKYRTLSVAPLSRMQIDYRLLVHDLQTVNEVGREGRWIWPSLQVLDSYYQKNLKVHAGGLGVKVDEKRGLGVLVPDTE